MTRNRGTDLPLPGATCGSTDDELGEHSAVRICEESLRPLSCMSANTSEPISTSIRVRSSNDAMAFVSRCVLNQHGAQVAACDDINRLDKHSLQGSRALGRGGRITRDQIDPVNQTRSMCGAVDVTVTSLLRFDVYFITTCQHSSVIQIYFCSIFS